MSMDIETAGTAMEGDARTAMAGVIGRLSAGDVEIELLGRWVDDDQGLAVVCIGRGADELNLQLAVDGAGDHLAVYDPTLRADGVERLIDRGVLPPEMRACLDPDVPHPLRSIRSEAAQSLLWAHHAAIRTAIEAFPVV